MPKITKLRNGSKERSGNLCGITQLIYGSTEQLGKITHLKSGSTETSGKLIKIRQLTCGSTERLSNFPNIT